MCMCVCMCVHVYVCECVCECVCVCLPTCVNVDSESNSVFRALPFFSFFFFYFSSILFTPPLFSSFFPHLSSIHFSPKIFPPSLMEGPSFFFSSIFFAHIFPLKFSSVFPCTFLVFLHFSLFVWQSIPGYSSHAHTPPSPAYSQCSARNRSTPATPVSWSPALPGYPTGSH